MTSHTLTAACGLLLLTASTLTAQSPAPAQPRPPQTYTAYLQAQYATIKRNIVGSADKMPAERFFYKPAPEVMTYAALLGHIVDAQYSYCSAVKGGPNPGAGKSFDELTDKPALIAAVNAVFAYCDDAFAALTDANATEMLTMGNPPNQRQAARANQLTMVIVHGNEHYGNLVTYMRTHGIVPPSSTPR
jgi:uncharacterized damage-inducible protein DinB